MLNRRNLLLGAAVTALMMTAPALADELKLPRQQVNLVAPPFVHEHEQATRQGPKIMQFKLLIEEKKMVIDNEGTTFQAMTFNGSMPGPLMVVHEGDYVEVTLVNPDTNSMPHNVDFHSATGALGGAELSLVNPGEQVTIRWKATRTGVFVYHCAPGGPMIPWHVVSGMNGAVMVLPREGLTDGKGKSLRYDKVVYIGEQDLYVPKDEKGKYKDYTSPGEAYTDTVEVMRKLTPTHVVFNGKVGALTGKNALTSKVGETVLIVHSQANRDSRPHLIGGHGDYVWETGKFGNAPQRDLVRPRRLRGCGALHFPRARHLRLCHAQSDRGRRARRYRPLQGRRKVER
jgi:nitrite reductase (NO-forming)